MTAETCQHQVIISAGFWDVGTAPQAEGKNRTCVFHFSAVGVKVVLLGRRLTTTNVPLFT